ncbi:kinase-like domain-containing protein, partial [Blyttiomyces helicus]
KVAIKILEKSAIRKTSGTAERVLREILVLAHLSHPNISRLLQVVDGASAIFLILEYEAGGELFDYIIKEKKVGEDIARRFFRQMVAAVQYCHSRGVVHRDLKPENLLMDDQGNIKIIDYGFANVMREGSLLDTFCGSAAYAAPEMISGKKYAGGEVDIWSLGIILFVLVAGHLPFDDRNMSRMFAAIMMGKFKFPDEMSTECKDLISQILKVNPKERATLVAIRDHPWMN